MIVVNEWLPNPVGKDASGEFVELFNSGETAIDVSGWALKASSKTKFILSGEIGARDYLLIKKPALKLSLNNSEGELSLFDFQGNEVERIKFFGQAPEGKSYSKTANGSFMFGEPTPGAENKFSDQLAMVGDIYLPGETLNRGLDGIGFLGLILGTAVVLTGTVIFIVKKNESLSNLFFGRDETSWR